jgi:prepilin-type processing-associated H-X9-DG protein
MNYPEFAKIITNSPTGQIMLKENQVSRPSHGIVYADGGAVTTATKDLSPDEWLPDIPYYTAALQFTGGGCGYFRVPTDGAPSFNYDKGDSRSLPRHNKRCNFGFFDGHAEALKNSKAGYQFYAGAPVRQPQPEECWWALRH